MRETYLHYITLPLPICGWNSKCREAFALGNGTATVQNDGRVCSCYNRKCTSQGLCPLSTSWQWLQPLGHLTYNHPLRKAFSPILLFLLGDGWLFLLLDQTKTKQNKKTKKPFSGLLWLFWLLSWTFYAFNRLPTNYLYLLILCLFLLSMLNGKKEVQIPGQRVWAWVCQPKHAVPPAHLCVRSSPSPRHIPCSGLHRIPPIRWRQSLPPFSMLVYLLAWLLFANIASFSPIIQKMKPPGEGQWKKSCRGWVVKIPASFFVPTPEETVLGRSSTLFVNTTSRNPAQEKTWRYFGGMASSLMYVFPLQTSAIGELASSSACSKTKDCISWRSPALRQFQL